MSEARSSSSMVEVAVDPLTAFAAFTNELDLWWVRGPINAYDSGRLVEMRCEPGIGGRILEVYDAESGEGLELARITVWEPGRRLAWKSSLDDVTIDVRFDTTATGTIVRLEATVSDGGEDRGGSSFVSVTPPWFGAWMRRRDTAPREARDLGRLALTLRYARPAAAARWLAEAFSFESPSPLPKGDDPLAGPPVDHAEVTHVPWVFVDDLEAHLERARANGATIVQDIESHGFTSYVAQDLEERRWRFAQARPTQPR